MRRLERLHILFFFFFLPFFVYFFPFNFLVFFIFFLEGSFLFGRDRWLFAYSSIISIILHYQTRLSGVVRTAHTARCIGGSGG